MKEKIGMNAGIVWNVLNEGPKQFRKLQKATKLSEKDFICSLWLAREEKVAFTETETKF